MLLNGSEILVQCLREQGVDTIFGYPGGAVLNIYDALFKHRDEIKHYLTSHEQGAAHAADGYARAKLAFVLLQVVQVLVTLLQVLLQLIWTLFLWLPLLVM